MIARKVKEGHLYLVHLRGQNVKVKVDRVTHKERGYQIVGTNCKTDRQLVFKSGRKFLRELPMGVQVAPGDHDQTHVAGFIRDVKSHRGENKNKLKAWLRSESRSTVGRTIQDIGEGIRAVILAHGIKDGKVPIAEQQAFLSKYGYPSANSWIYRLSQMDGKERARQIEECHKGMFGVLLPSKVLMRRRCAYRMMELGGLVLEPRQLKILQATRLEDVPQEDRELMELVSPYYADVPRNGRTTQGESSMATKKKEPKKVTTKKEDGSYKVTHVIRWCTAKGLDTTQTRAVLENLGLEYSSSTISIQRSAFKSGKVVIPEFDAGQLRELKAALPEKGVKDVVKQGAKKKTPAKKKTNMDENEE